MRRIERKYWGVGCVLALTMAGAASPAFASDPPVGGTTEPPSLTASEQEIPDPDIRAWWNLTYDRKPPAPVPGKDYGMDPASGKFVHPKATPLVRKAPSFPGQLSYWDQKSYKKNVDVLAFYDFIPSAGHTWQSIADFGNKRYMYVYYRSGLGIFDITDPRKAKLVYRRGQRIVAHGKRDIVNPYAKGDGFGAANIQWHKGLGKYVMVQAFEVPRYGVMDAKYREPEGVKTLKHWSGLKGFRVYAMDGPLPDQWKLIAERTTDYRHPYAPYGQQQ